MEKPASDLVWSQLEKVLDSDGFARNERLRGFLRFVVDEELSGRGSQTGRVLSSVQPYSGRKPDYDVRQDSVVRTEAVKLRGRLMEYYTTAGAADPVVIELPKGGYKPVFRSAGRPAESPRSGDVRQVSRLRLQWTGAAQHFWRSHPHTGGWCWSALTRRTAPNPRLQCKRPPEPEWESRRQLLRRRTHW